MDRTRRSLASSAAAGLVLVALSAFVVSSVATSTGCSTVETTSPPDASAASCNEGPSIFCEVAAAGQPSCSTDDPSSPLLARLPRATSYAVGCVANFVGPRDEQGDCRLDAVCKCIIGDIRGRPVAVPDAGNPALDGDAGDAGADAAVPTPPDPAPPAPTTGPLWLCDP